MGETTEIPRADAIMLIVSNHFKVSVTDLIGPKRYRKISHPRAIAMYLIREMTSFSYPRIGRVFGGKDHSTVITAVKKIRRLMFDDATLWHTVNAIRARVTNGGSTNGTSQTTEATEEGSSDLDLVREET